MNKSAILGLFISGLLSTNQAIANTGWGIHFNAGTAKYDYDGITLSDDSDTTFSAGLFYGFSNALSVEAAYNDFGSAEVLGNEIEFSSTSLALVYAVTLSNNLSLTGKLGAEKIKGESNININNPFINFNFNISESSTEAFAGIGLNYALNNVISLRSDFTFRGSDDADINTFTAGLKYRF